MRGSRGSEAVINSPPPPWLKPRINLTVAIVYTVCVYAPSVLGVRWRSAANREPSSGSRKEWGQKICRVQDDRLNELNISISAQCTCMFSSPSACTFSKSRIARGGRLVGLSRSSFRSDPRRWRKRVSHKAGQLDAVSWEHFPSDVSNRLGPRFLGSLKSFRALRSKLGQ